MLSLSTIIYILQSYPPNMIRIVIKAENVQQFNNEN